MGLVGYHIIFEEVFFKISYPITQLHKKEKKL
jgi:hypothetical protein